MSYSTLSRVLQVAKQAVSDRITNEFRLILKVHLLQDTGLVGAHGLDRQVQPLGNIGYALSRKR